MWTRRRLIMAAVGGFGGLMAGRLAVVDARAGVVTVVRKRLFYLRLDEAGVQQFATELVAIETGQAEARTEAFSKVKLKMLQAAAPLYRRIDFTGRHSLAATMRRSEERIVSAYLLSTDFFQNGADVTKVVRFLRLYNPGQNLDECSAPFARPLSTP